MNLYMFHCGFYPSDDIYEQHKNFFIVAENEDKANSLIGTRLAGEEIKYHVDGMIHIDIVGGHKITAAPIRFDNNYCWEVINGTLMRV